MTRRQLQYALTACAAATSLMLVAVAHAADKQVPQWPKVAEAAPPPIEPEYLPQWPLIAAEPWWYSAFKIEGGGRYWFSTSNINFGFTNGHPLFGNPTSTLDWKGTRAHAGEAFARVDHKPTGLYLKGIIGGGGIAAPGEMIDRDFLAGQIKFSDTTSDVKQNSFGYASIDLGVSYIIPDAGVRFGAFVGYQYWHEKVTAYGARCQPDDIQGQFCGPPGAQVVPTTIPAVMYEPTWHAVRLGVEGRMKVTPSLWLSGEIAGIPYATLVNNDSHLLRQSPADLGPAPNVISTSRNGYGVQAEVFVNYAIAKNWEVGGGLRYWGLIAAGGNVQFGPDFGVNYDLTKFEQQRYGVLLQLKGKL